MARLIDVCCFFCRSLRVMLCHNVGQQFAVKWTYILSLTHTHIYKKKYCRLLTFCRSGLITLLFPNSFHTLPTLSKVVIVFFCKKSFRTTKASVLSFSIKISSHFHPKKEQKKKNEKLDKREKNWHDKKKYAVSGEENCFKDIKR